ncbi:MAG: GNAT family N-acetyltransferase [Polyangia bacterium]
MLTVREVSDDEALQALEPGWRALCGRARGVTPFQLWEWTAGYLKHARQGRPLVLVAEDPDGGDGDGPVGILALRIERYYGTPLRRVRFLTAPLADYQDLIARPGRERECRDAFFAHLARERRRWDLIDLADLRAGTELAELTEAELPAGLRLRSTVHRQCPFIPLPATWEAYNATLGKNLRANIGRRRRQLAKQFRLELTLADEASLDSALTDLFQLHNQRWRERGQSGAFSKEPIQRFHRDVARGFLSGGHLRLHLVRLDGVTRAAFYCFQLGGRVYYYLSGYDPELARYSLGTVTLSEALMAAIREGVTEFDLLRGDETYKYEWQGQDRVTRRLLLWHGGLRSQLAWQGSRLERHLEHAGLRWQRRRWGRKPERDKAGATSSDKDPDKDQDKAQDKAPAKGPDKSPSQGADKRKAQADGKAARRPPDDGA